MQVKSNFFYAEDFANLILNIARYKNDEDKFIESCNKLFCYLVKYKNSRSRNEFSRRVETILNKTGLKNQTKLKGTEDCVLLIDSLKKIPVRGYREWGYQENNILKFVKIPGIKKSTKKKEENLLKATNKSDIIKNNKETKYIATALKLLYDDIKFRKMVLQRDCTGTFMDNQTYVKLIFQHLNGNEKLSNEQLESCYEQLGKMRNKEQTSEDWTKTIKSWYEKPIPTNNSENIENSKKTKTIKGLSNINLSCYLNTALQSLYYDKQFRKMVLNSSCKGKNYEKKLSIKLIFQHLNGPKEELPYDQLKACYNQIGHKKYVTSTSDEWRQKIQSWFEDEYKPQNEINTTCLTQILSSKGGLSESTLTESDPHIEKNETLPNQINIEVPRSKYKPKSKTDVHQGVILTRDKSDIKPTEIMKFKGNSYQLTFATVHTGKDSGGGHYYSYVKRGNTWTKLNDNKVDVCKWGNIKNDIGTNCTFLRYEKIV